MRTLWAFVLGLCVVVMGSATAASENELLKPLPNYSVSWIGNSFSGGDAGWVPQDVQDIFVAADGTVYTTVGWEEHRGNIAAIRDGRIEQQSAHWKRGGIDRLVGETITGNEQYIFFATGTPDGHDGKVQGTSIARRSRADITDRKQEKRASLGVRIHGLAWSGERLYATCDDDRVRVFDGDLQPLGEWEAAAPGEAAIDRLGRIWLIDRRANVLRCYDDRGRLVTSDVGLPEGAVPTDLAVTSNDQLLVADGGPRRQVYIFSEASGKPRPQRALGVRGGVFAGPTPGKFAPDRFVSPIGVGADAAGNLYVACGPYAKTHGGTTVIRCFSPEGVPRWVVMSTQWLDTVDVDRQSGGAILYGCRHRYAIDLMRPPGRQWNVEALTVDPTRYPEDPRLNSAAIGGVRHRRIGGRSYLYVSDMNGNNMYVFRFDPAREGETAVFCAHLGAKEFWVDRNENGRKDADESENTSIGECRGWDVEPNGTVWQATLRHGLYEHPLTEFSKKGVPLYRSDRRIHHPMPKPFIELRRTQVDRQEGIVYLAGSTAEAKAHHWKPMGPNLMCFDLANNPWKLLWQIVLPHETGPAGHESFEPFDFAVEGDYIFVVYAGRLPSQKLPPGTVVVIDKHNRRLLGYMHPSGTRHGEVPMDALQDIVHSINAYRTPQGDYLVFIEDDGYTKNVLYRWRP